MMWLEQAAPYWPAAAGIAAVVAIAAAVGRVILVVSRHMRGRVVRRRTAVVTDIVTPLLDKRFQVVDTAMLNLRLEQAATAKVVGKVMAIVSDGLQTDVAEIRREQVLGRKEQARVAGRIDDIYKHLLGD